MSSIYRIGRFEVDTSANTVYEAAGDYLYDLRPAGPGTWEFSDFNGAEWRLDIGASFQSGKFVRSATLRVKREVVEAELILAA